MAMTEAERKKARAKARKYANAAKAKGKKVAVNNQAGGSTAASRADNRDTNRKQIAATNAKRAARQAAAKKKPATKKPATKKPATKKPASAKPSKPRTVRDVRRGKGKMYTGGGF